MSIDCTEGVVLLNTGALSVDDALIARHKRITCFMIINIVMLIDPLSLMLH